MKIFEKKEMAEGRSSCLLSVHGLKAFFIFIFLWSFCFSVSIVSADPSSPVWLEKKPVRRMGMMGSEGKGEKAKPGGHPGAQAQDAKPGHPGKQGSDAKQGHPGAQPAAKTHGSQEQKPEKKKTRRPMSRPAAYLLKTGDFPQVTDSPELLKTVCWLKSPDQSYKRIAPKKTDEGILIYDEALLGGLYQIFLYHDAGVKDGVRYYHSSTTWFRNVGEEDFETKLASQEPRQGMYEDQPVFYLKELTKDNEDNFVTQRRYTGDSLPVQALFQGQPVAGLPVTLTTQQGWEKTVVTDDKGIASFLLIKEVFHTDKVHKDPEAYFIKSSYQVEAKGELEGVTYEKEVYVANLRLPVFPTPSDWESKSAGFYLVMGSILAVLFAAAIRRRRMRTI